MESNSNLIRNFVDKENDLINHRMNWFLVLQGFMFSGLAFGWEKSVYLCIIFSCVGLLSSISVGLLLRFGILAMKNIEEQAAEKDGVVIGRRHKATNRIVHFLLPWNMLPVLFSFAWVAISIVRIIEGR